MERIDQNNYLNNLNPLDLDLNSDMEWYTPTTISRNEWMFLNHQIDDAPSLREIGVNRGEWTNFIDGFSTPLSHDNSNIIDNNDDSDDDEDNYTDEMETVVDEDQFTYNLDDYGFVPPTYQSSFDGFYFDQLNNENDIFLYAAPDYEDIHILFEEIDNGDEEERESYYDQPGYYRDTIYI